MGLESGCPSLTHWATKYPGQYSGNVCVHVCTTRLLLHILQYGSFSTDTGKLLVHKDELHISWEQMLKEFNLKWSLMLVHCTHLAAWSWAHWRGRPTHIPAALSAHAPTNLPLFSSLFWCYCLQSHCVKPPNIGAGELWGVEVLGCLWIFSTVNSLDKTLLESVGKKRSCEFQPPTRLA